MHKDKDNIRIFFTHMSLKSYQPGGDLSLSALNFHFLKQTQPYLKEHMKTIFLSDILVLLTMLFLTALC